MPANGYNLGKDVTLDIVTATGMLRPKIKTGFSSRQETHSIQIMGLDGVNRFDELPAGWSGTFDLDRGDSSVDDYFANAEANYYNGAPTPIVTITETIQEVTGGISQYRYTGVVLKLDDAGSKTGDKQIAMKVSFKASKRIKVA